jgi:ABC-2 type transport system ATP-binding protein
VNTDLFKAIIKEEIAKNKYLIMSSHQMPTIEEFCSDITILNRGKAVLQGNLNEIKKGYGRVNLFVKSDVDIASYISSFGLAIVEKTPSEYHLKVQSEDQAMQFLAKMINDKVPIVKFELREPSLHEIFIEKVGDVNE